jgi:hypothetical protein
MNMKPRQGQKKTPFLGPWQRISKPGCTDSSDELVRLDERVRVVDRFWTYPHFCPACQRTFIRRQRRVRCMYCGAACVAAAEQAGGDRCSG